MVDREHVAVKIYSEFLTEQEILSQSAIIAPKPDLMYDVAIATAMECRRLLESGFLRLQEALPQLKFRNTVYISMGAPSDLFSARIESVLHQIFDTGEFREIIIYFNIVRGGGCWIKVPGYSDRSISIQDLIKNSTNCNLDDDSIDMIFGHAFYVLLRIPGGLGKTFANSGLEFRKNYTPKSVYEEYLELKEYKKMHGHKAEQISRHFLEVFPDFLMSAFERFKNELPMLRIECLVIKSPGSPRNGAGAAIDFSMIWIPDDEGIRSLITRFELTESGSCAVHSEAVDDIRELNIEISIESGLQEEIFDEIIGRQLSALLRKPEMVPYT